MVYYINPNNPNSNWTGLPVPPFGILPEPSKEEMDQIISEFPDIFDFAEQFYPKDPQGAKEYFKI